MDGRNNLVAAVALSAMSAADREFSKGRGCQGDGSRAAQDAARARAEAKRARKLAARALNPTEMEA